jgi:hypothetical protein
MSDFWFSCSSSARRYGFSDCEAGAKTLKFVVRPGVGMN